MCRKQEGNDLCTAQSPHQAVGHCSAARLQLSFCSWPAAYKLLLRQEACRCPPWSVPGTTTPLFLHQAEVWAHHPQPSPPQAHTAEWHAAGWPLWAAIIPQAVPLVILTEGICSIIATGQTWASYSTQVPTNPVIKLISKKSDDHFKFEEPYQEREQDGSPQP